MKKSIIFSFIITILVAIIFSIAQVCAFQKIGGAAVHDIDYNKLPPTVLLAGKATSTTGIITKVDLATFTEGDSLTLSLNAALYAGVIDRVNKIAYYCNAGSSSQIYISKVDLATFTEVAVLKLDANDQVCKDMTIDTANQLLYVAVNSGNIGVVKIDLTTFTKIDSLLVGLPATSYYLLLGPTGTYLYYSVSVSSAQAKIIKIQTSDMSIVASVKYGDSSGPGNDMLISGNYIYFGYGGGGYYGHISKIDITTFTGVANITTAGCGGTAEGTFPAEIDIANGFMYWFNNVSDPTNDTFFSLGKLKISTFTGVDCVALSTSRISPNAADIDLYSVRKHTIYAGVDGSSIVVKYTLEPFVESTKLTLSSAGDVASVLLY